MKRNYLNQIVSLLLISLTVVFVSCKKDKLTEHNPMPTKQEVKMDPQVEAIVKRINTFGRQLEDVKRGVYRNESYVDIDSTMWNIEALFNSTFSMPDENYVEKRIQELYFDLSMHRGNKLSIYDVNTLYEDIIQSVKEAYINDGIYEDKGLMSIIVDKDHCDSRAAKLKVTVVSGRTNANMTPSLEFYFGGPFDIDGCWYYGEFGGTCDDPFLLTDAAEALEGALNKNHGTLPLSEENKNIYVDLTMISTKGTEYRRDNGEPYTFYEVNCNHEDLYLTGKELNEYYYWEKQMILNCVPNDPQFMQVLPQDPTFVEINIDGLSYMSGKDMFYYHNHDILYGTKCEVPRSVIGKTMNILNY